jgi:hypothetical protein
VVKQQSQHVVHKNKEKQVMRAEMQELQQHLNLAATKELRQKAAAVAKRNNS